MKILFVIAHIGKGGGQVTQSIRLIKEISKHHDVKLLTLRYESDIVDEPCETIYAGPLKFPMGIFHLWKKLITMKEKFDVIQCFDGYFALPAVWLSGRRPYFLRLGLSAKGDFLSRGKTSLSRFADAVLFPIIFSSGFIVNSKELAKDMRFYRPEVIHNGYELGKLTEDKKKLRKELGIPPDSFIMTYTGKIIERKNLEVIFESLKYLDGVRFLFVGNQDEEHYGSSYFQSLKSRYPNEWKKVIVTGEVHMDKVRRYLMASDIFVFPSKLEGSPNSVLEAMSVGLPVICSNILNHKEIISHGRNGFLFKDTKDIICLVKMLQSDMDLARKIGQNAIESIRARHDIKNAAKKYIESYRRCISK
ncbi:MAG: glycosyltransferase family 4 protein [Candidatus Woesearchaeota archaeon]|nr:glycosyltransferase family 4 protein [Candidatus Woesearchaeota archaeon]